MIRFYPTKSKLYSKMFFEKFHSCKNRFVFYSEYDLIDAIEKEYRKKIKQDKKYIYYEKILLEDGIHIKSEIDPTNIIVGAYSILATFLVFYFTKYMHSYSDNFVTIYMEILVLPLLVVFVFNNYYTQEIRMRRAFRHLCLNILLNLEKEIENKKINVSNLANDEVGATVETENQPKPVKPISKQANGNWNVEINMLSLVDAIGAIYKAGKIAKKMFRKKK